MSQKKSPRNDSSRFNVSFQVKALTLFVFPSNAHALGCTNGWRAILWMFPVGLKKSRGGHKITRRIRLSKWNKR